MEMYEMGPDSRPNTKNASPDLVRGDSRANGIEMPRGMAVKKKKWKRSVNHRVLQYGKASELYSWGQPKFKSE